MAKEMETATLVAEKRNESGSRLAKRLRQNGWMPCIMYTPHKPSQSLKVKRHDFMTLVRHHGRQNVIIDLDINGDTPHKVLLKDLQLDHITDYAIHADFLEISMTKKLRMMVAIQLKGEPVGVTQQDGILEHLLRTVEVECLPTDIVKEFQMDVSGLNIDDSLFVRDIKADPKLTIMTQGDIAVASVHMPRVEEEEVKPEVEEEAEAKEAAEEGEAAEKTGEKKETEEKEQDKGQKESEGYAEREKKGKEKG